MRVIKRIPKPHEVPPEYLPDLMSVINAEMADKCRKSLRASLMAYWSILEPTTAFKDNWHIQCMIEYLEAFHRGDFKRLLINMPPRNMKSILSNIIFPVFLWANNPSLRILSFSYADTLSKKFNINRRTIIQSDLYRSMYPHIRLTDDMNTQKKIENEDTGMMFSTSIGGAVTGEGGDYLIVDDPHDPTGAESDAQRESAVGYFKTTLQSRLNDPNEGRILVIMQRLHENDISGHCLESGGYTHLCLPSIEEVDRKIYFPISGKNLTRQEGQVLWENHQSLDILNDLKKRMGSYAFAGQYQQRPAPAEGGLIKDSWWKYYQGVPDERLYMNILSVDATFKNTDTSDYVVIQRWGKSETGRMYLLENLRKRLTFIETVGAINYMRRAGDAIYIEDKANGTAIIEVLRRKVSGIIAYTPKESKVSRINAVTPWIESGSVYLPTDADWLENYLKEFKYFPNGAHDDQIDATSQALLHLKDVDPAPKPKASVNRYKSFEVDSEDTNDESWHKSIFKMGGEFIGF